MQRPLNMPSIVFSGLLAACTGMIAVWQYTRMSRHQNRERSHVDEHPAAIDDTQIHHDHGQLNALIGDPAAMQLPPLQQELQDAISAADAVRVMGVLGSMGARHPDSLKLDRGLTPLMLAASIHVRTEAQDSCLKRIMHVLLERGARITQREDLSGVTAMHLLACQPLACSIIHRLRYLLAALDDHRMGSGPHAMLPGIMFDPVLNAAPADGSMGDSVDGGWMDGRHMPAVHLLGMRCNRGLLPESAAAGHRKRLLRNRRRMLPVCLQDTCDAQNAIAAN